MNLSSDKKIKSIMFGFKTAKGKRRIKLVMVTVGIIIFFMCLSSFSLQVKQQSAIPDTLPPTHHKKDIRLDNKKILETASQPSSIKTSQNNNNNANNIVSKQKHHQPAQYLNPTTPTPLSPSQIFFNSLPKHIQKQVETREKKNYAHALKYDSNGIIPAQDFFDGLDAVFEKVPLFKISLIRELFNIDNLNNNNNNNKPNHLISNNNNNNNNNNDNINNININNNINQNIEYSNFNGRDYDEIQKINNINNNNNNNNNNNDHLDSVYRQEIVGLLKQENIDDISKFKVTIVTQTTVDRLYKVAAMASRWKSPISVSLYIKTENDIDKLENAIRENNVLAVYVDFHLFYHNNTRYPVNNLRNLAIQNALTEHVLLLDVDFIPPNHLHDHIASYIHENGTSTIHSPSGLNAFVIPSFSSNLSPKDIPNSKSKFIEMVEKKKIEPSNLRVCPKCHSPTDYPKWMTATEPYAIEYHWIYEPFLVYNRSQTIPFDERFKGYGFDKNSHIFAMAAQGFQFSVLPDAYIVHINHPTSRWDGPSLDDQQWDVLRVLCVFIPEIRDKYSNGVKQLFDEPNSENCHSNEHW